MTNTATIRARAARWAEHDARVPFFDDRLARLNGTNPAGRRPHSFLEPTRKSVFALIAANDNEPVGVLLKCQMAPALHRSGPIARISTIENMAPHAANS